ncbi:class I SAM-dependent methyltransferase [Nocardiopsis sp. ARC36]
MCSLHTYEPFPAPTGLLLSRRIRRAWWHRPHGHRSGPSSSGAPVFAKRGQRTTAVLPSCESSPLSTSERIFPAERQQCHSPTRPGKYPHEYRRNDDPERLRRVLPEQAERLRTSPGHSVGHRRPPKGAGSDPGRRGIRSPVLEIGCGLGDNAIHLARHGHRVVAVDVSPTAVAEAALRAREAGVSVDFRVEDATRIDASVGDFATVVDIAHFHCLDDSERSLYLEALHGVSHPGTRLVLLGLSDRAPESTPGLRRLSEHELRTSLSAAGWWVRSMRASVLDAPSSAGGDPAWLVEAERL